MTLTVFRSALSALRHEGGSKAGLYGLDFLLGGLIFGDFPAGNRVLSILKQNLLVGVSGKIALPHLFQDSGPIEEGCLIFWLQTETLIEVVKGHL